MESTNYSIHVHVRRTGEVIEVSVTPSKTTHDEIIKKVCQKIKEPEPSHYYLTLDYAVELENDHIFQRQREGARYQLVMRTKYLFEYLAEKEAIRNLRIDEMMAMKALPTSLPQTTQDLSESTTTTSISHQESDQDISKFISLTSLLNNESDQIISNAAHSVIERLSRHNIQNYLSRAVGKEFDIVLMGPPRVGKSTLINAILHKDVAQTNAGYDPVTKEFSYYEYEESYTTETEDQKEKVSTSSIRIWDSPGIEQWTNLNVTDYVQNLITKKNPVCLIFCASPGTYVEPEKLKDIVERCKVLKVFIAMVVTNMYVSDEATIILDIFKDTLSHYHKQTKVENNMYYYGPVGLCIQVNSIDFVTGDITKESEGIDQLMLGIMHSLRSDKRLQWCFAIQNNAPFWFRTQQQIWDICNSP